MTTTIDNKTETDMNGKISKVNGLPQTFNEFAHNYNSMKVYAKFMRAGCPIKDSKEIARHYDQTFYAPVMNLINYPCLTT